MKSITILLPGGAPYPVGGIKVAFEYANRFVVDGFEVHVMMPMSLLWSEHPLGEKLKSIIRYPQNLFTGKYKPYKWFDLDRRIQLHLVWSLRELFAPKTDAYIATSAETAEYLAAYKRVAKEQKYYFIQHYENWNLCDARVRAGYRLPLQKIVIAQWLRKIVESEGEQTAVVENGFDCNEFYQTIPFEAKEIQHICMLYHKLPIKGCDDGFETLRILKKRYPELQATLFGMPEMPPDLPSWITYCQNPSKSQLNNIYNKAAIFMGTSHFEGWGLTIGEAMMCGAAVACTDNEGYKEMAIDGKTALLSPIKQPQALADNITKLIENDELRHTIAQGGTTYIASFTQDNAYNKFKKTIVGGEK